MEKKPNSFHSILLNEWRKWNWVCLFLFPAAAPPANSKIFWLAGAEQGRSGAEPFNSFLLFCLAQRESKKKRELMDLPRLPPWCATPQSQSNPLPSIHAEWKGRSSWIALLRSLSISFSFHESINSFSSRSLLLAEPLAVPPPITHQSKREEKNCFHHSRRERPPSKVSLIQLLHCGLFFLWCFNT